MTKPDQQFLLRLGFLLHDVSRLRRNVIDRALMPLGVTRAQWWILAFLSRVDGMSQNDLASELDLGKVALSGLLDRLESAGLVERRADEQDKRLKRVFLRGDGKALIGKIREQVRETEAAIVQGLQLQELRPVADALARIKGNLLDMLTADREKD